MEANMHTGSSGVAPPQLGSSGVQPKVPNVATHVGIIAIKAGEGIGEKIRSYFENREGFPSLFKEHAFWGCILSAQGIISSPTVETLGSVSSYEGSYVMMQLSGIYSIPKDGPVQLHGGLRVLCTISDSELFGGSIIGSLIAAEPLQVMVLTFIDEDTENVSRANQ